MERDGRSNYNRGSGGPARGGSGDGDGGGGRGRGRGWGQNQGDQSPCRQRISFGRCFYPKEFRARDDLGYGVAAFRGFQQSLKPTSQGLALRLDFSVLPFRKQLPVIDFVKEHVRGFQEVDDVRRLRREVTCALKGLKVTVTHRVTNQNYIISGLSNQNVRDVTFVLEDREGNDPPREISLVEYFREKYNKEIMFHDIPCLDLGKSYRNNYVPMEFCILVEGQGQRQRYPKEQLDNETGLFLKNTIYEMVQSEDGPCGDKCQWNLLGKSVVEGRPLERWALIDFSSFDCDNRLNPDLFIPNLINRCTNLGIRVEEPVVCRFTGMHEFSSIASIQELLESVVKEANRKCKDQLQLIVFVMPRKHDSYEYLEWLSETQIGVLTQCCLVSHANKGQDQYLANLALQINAKIGGSNVELNEPESSSSSSSGASSSFSSATSLDERFNTLQLDLHNIMFI